MQWHLITSEYPPQRGGVSDYTQLVATGLASAGDSVHVWCPAETDQHDEISEAAGVFVHRELGRIAPADLRRVGKMLDQFPAPRRLLVQWVPHGYGYRAMNVPFCFWLWNRARRGDIVEVMAHEPFLSFGEGSTKQDIAAAVHRVMVALLLKAAHRVWISIPLWEASLRPYTLGSRVRFRYLPVPSSVPVIDDPAGIAAIRRRCTPVDGFLVGHFGAYDRYMATLMTKLLPMHLLDHAGHSILLLGTGSLELRNGVISTHPELAERLHATGTLTAEDVSRHISACDLMLQPYQDGVSGRRTSVMTALSHGVPVVSNIAEATEECWAETGAVILTEPGDVTAMSRETNQLLNDPAARKRMSVAAQELYLERFHIEHTVCALREANGR